MTTPANLESYATQTARLLDINLPRGGAALVAAQLDVLFAHAPMRACSRSSICRPNASR